MAWFDALTEEKDRHEADIIVRTFAQRHEHHVDIGGVTTADGRLAFMYAKDRLLVREQYLQGGLAGVHGPQSIQSAHQQRGVLDVLQDLNVATVEVRRVAAGIVVVRLNPEVKEETRHEGTSEGNDFTSEGNEGNPERNDSSSWVNGGTREGDGGTRGGDGGTRGGDGGTRGGDSKPPEATTVPPKMTVRPLEARSTTRSFSSGPSKRNSVPGVATLDGY